MCYSANMSYTLFTLGAVITSYLFIKNPKLPYNHVPIILLFYTLMELLQGIQYKYVNDCDNKMNKLLTEIAYIFVIVQPFMWNVFFYLNSTTCDKQVFLVGISMAICWMLVNILARIMYTPDAALIRYQSVFAGKEVCTKKNASHLFWEWTFANFEELNANFLLYLLIWFIPALVTARHRLSSIILILSACVGVFMTYKAGEIQIFTAAWCYISVPIVLCVIIADIILNKI